MFLTKKSQKLQRFIGAGGDAGDFGSHLSRAAVLSGRARTGGPDRGRSHLISSVRCKMGCNCGRRPAASGPAPAPAPSVRRPAPRAVRTVPAPAPRQAPVPVQPSVEIQSQPPVEPRHYITPTGVTVPAGGGGLHTSLWGPPLWRILHTAAQYTTSIHRRLTWIRMLTAMTGALPCAECSAHYNAWITANPVSLPLSGVELQVAISSWILALHNDVNRRNDVAPWTLEQVAAAYTDKAAARAAFVTLKTNRYISTSLLDYLEHLL